jgi:hypothetical protein
VVGETRGPLGSADAITGGTALPTAFVERGFSAQLRLQDEFSAPANRNRVLLSALDLEAGNGAAAVFASGTLQGNPGAGSTLGFPTVGLRGRVLGTDQRTLSLGGDVSIDISNAAGGLDLTRARVWLAGGLRLGALSLSTTQAIFTASPGSGYEGSLVSGYLVCPGLLLQAELDADVGGPCASGTCAGGAAALGARSRWYFLELGASLRSGLFTDGRTLWGKPGALVTLGLRFGGRDWIVSP